MRFEDSDYLVYIKQLYKFKIDNDWFTWDQFASDVNNKFYLNYSKDKYRKECKARFDIVNSDSDSCDDFQHDTKSDDETIYTDYRDEQQDQIIQMNKSMQALKDQRTNLSRIYRQMSREDYLRDIAIECASIVSLNNPYYGKLKISHAQWGQEKQGILQLSDWHYGIEIDNFFNKFNSGICAERVNRLLQKVIDICKEQQINTINVMNLGDMISGRIHSQILIENKEDIITQVIEVSELLASFLDKLSDNFTVNYYACLDNHSRIEPNKKQALRLESLQRLITWYLKERFKNISQVRIYDQNVISDDIIMFDCLGHSIMGVHGDLDSQKTVIKNLKLFTQRVNKNVDLICSAHLHHFSADEEGDCMLISNPSLMGTDSFAESKRLYSHPAQNLIISTENNVVDQIHRIIL